MMTRTIGERYTLGRFVRLSAAEVARVTGVSLGYTPKRVFDMYEGWRENDPEEVGWTGYTWAGEMVCDPCRTMREAKAAIYHCLGATPMVTDEDGPTANAYRNQVLDTLYDGEVSKEWSGEVVFV